MKKINNKDILEVLIGIILFIIANILSFGYNYNKFYFLLVLGIFLVMKGIYSHVNKKEFLSIKNFIKVYFAFLILGIIGDLIFGLYISKLWVYPNYDLVNYLLLYIFVYPFGGFLMIYTFSLFESIFIKKTKETNLRYKTSLITSLTLYILCTIGLIISIILINTNKGFWIYFFIAFGGFGLLSFLLLKIKKDSLLKRLLSKPLQYIILILFVSIFQGLIHEILNVFAKEWIYKNMILNQLNLFGVPIIVIIAGWLGLLLVPYSVYELIIELKKELIIKTWQKN